MTKQLPDAEVLKSLFEYNSNIGDLIWKPRPREMFGTHMQFGRWNKAYAGTVAGRITNKGYRSIKVFAGSYSAHRLVWKLVTGEDPGELDHINRNKADNRFSNLRDVSRSVNMKNKGVGINNSSGHKHIHWMPKIKKWTVQLIVPGKGQRQLAYCETIEGAVKVRNRLYDELGYYK